MTSGNSIVSLTLDGIAASGNGTNGCEGVIVATAGTLTILNSTISNNPCIAVFNEINPTEINIANTTISGNNDTSNGLGAIYRNGAGTYNLNNVTVTNNTPDGFNNSSTATGAINVRNSIIAGNRTASGTPKDITGAFVSQGNNLIGNTTGGTGFTQPTDKTNVAANLGALANNGGQTDTHLPQTGSPAIDAGNNCVLNQSCGTNNPPVALTRDQRGGRTSRAANGVVDIGAIEAQIATAAAVSISRRVLRPDGRGLTNAVVYLTDQRGATTATRTGAFGFYRFDKVAAGETVIVTVASKRYAYAPQIIAVTGEIGDLNFTPGK